MTGTHAARCAQLPNTRGMKSKVIIQKAGRCDEDICVQVAGCQVVEIGSRPWGLTAALDGDAAAAVTCDWDSIGRKSLLLSR